MAARQRISQRVREGEQTLMPTRLRALHPLRAACAVLVATYLTAYLRRADAFLLLDHVDLAIHEAGHVLFAPLGEFAGIAGGTILQLVVPAAFVLYFARTGQRYAAFIVLFWVAQSMHNVAVYMGDARAQLLPLVGGEYVIHDWAYMLSRLRLLQEDRALADAVKATAALAWFAALGGALIASRRTLPDPSAETTGAAPAAEEPAFSR
jgi:hypothetical protein